MGMQTRPDGPKEVIIRAGKTEQCGIATSLDTGWAKVLGVHRRKGVQAVGKTSGFSFKDGFPASSEERLRQGWESEREVLVSAPVIVGDGGKRNTHDVGKPSCRRARAE